MHDGHILAKQQVDSLLHEAMKEIERKQYASQIPPHVCDFMLHMTEFSMKTAYLDCLDAPEDDVESATEPVPVADAAASPDRHLGSSEDKEDRQRQERRQR